MASRDESIQELYQAPLAQFVAERKRLAGELRAAGDRDGATALLACKRPTMSAWVVNQLYWHARDGFDDLFATAARLRTGDLSAQAAHRSAIADLRARAARFLTDAGHAAAEPTLRRVTTTLAALAATGSFDPDPAGALVEDRDPPGFEVGVVGLPTADYRLPPEKNDEIAKRRAEAENKRKQQERARLEAALVTAKGEVHVAERQLELAHAKLDETRRAVRELETQLEQLE